MALLKAQSNQKCCLQNLSPMLPPDLQRDLGMTEDQRSIAMFTCDIDDCAYTAIDEATKAEVKVVYAKSFYAGAAHSSALSPVNLSVFLPVPNPAGNQKQALTPPYSILPKRHGSIRPTIPTILYILLTRFPEPVVIFQECAGIPEGQPLAYLIAPPIEAVFGVDAAIKAADVSMPLWYGPPTETNFGGALLTGSQSACKAATEAFRDAVIAVARNPHDFDV